MTAPTQAYVTVDIVALHELEGDNPYWEVVLVKRKNEPFKGQWVFPGGFVDPDERVEEAAAREFAEETGLSFPENDFFLLFTASEPKRDPRGRAISLVYSTVLFDDELKNLQAGDDAAELKVVRLEEAMQMDLGFDHNEILYKVVNARSYYANR